MSKPLFSKKKQSSELQHKVLINEGVLKEIEQYKSDLKANIRLAGNRLHNRLRKKLKNKDLGKMPLAEFIQILLDTKKPNIEAESAEKFWQRERLDKERSETSWFYFCFMQFYCR